MPSPQTPKSSNSSDDNTENGVADQKRKDQQSHIAQDAAAPEHDLPAQLPEEHGGQSGLEPTRYGDWEKKGRCTDF